MKVIKNIQNLSVAELLYELYNTDEELFISDLDFIKYIKITTNEYSEYLMFLLYDDVYWFVSNIEVEIKLSEIKDNARFAEMRESARMDIEAGDNSPITVSLAFIIYHLGGFENPNIAEELYELLSELSYDKSMCELVNIHGARNILYFATTLNHVLKKEDIKIPEEFVLRRISIKEKDIIPSNFKRPTNTLKQQIALLEHTGTIDHLMSTYGRNDLKLSELLSNILNRDKQNIRELLSFSTTKDRQSNDPKNQDFMNELFDKIKL